MPKNFLQLIPVVDPMQSLVDDHPMTGTPGDGRCQRGRDKSRDSQHRTAACWSPPPFSSNLSGFRKRSRTGINSSGVFLDRNSTGCHLGRSVSGGNEAICGNRNFWNTVAILSLARRLFWSILTPSNWKKPCDASGRCRLDPWIRLSPAAFV